MQKYQFVCGYKPRFSGKAAFRNLFIVLLISILYTSCIRDVIDNNSPPAERYDAKFLVKYLDFICKTARVTEGFFPPQVARAYGYIGVANYEAVIHGIDPSKSLVHQLNGLSNYNVPVPERNLQYNWAIASNAATARMTRYMFEKRISAARRNTLDSLENVTHQALAANENPLVASRSQKFGMDVADVIFEYSKVDGGHESYLNPFQLPFSLPDFEHVWVPTGAIMHPLSPRWGQNRPFMTVNIALTQPVAHTLFSKETTTEFYREAMIVYNQVRNNTAEEVEIAKYWADDPFATCTPAGHTFNILMQILDEENCTLAKSSVGFAKMAIAENDAFISCWKGKYDYNLLRPVTYIKRYIDPSFNTVIGTPPFPAYTSGHSSEIGAAERILTSLFTNGSGDYQFTDYSQLQYGFNARNFRNFSQMAEECANSRLYGGIHYPMDNSKGLQTGRAIGDNVNRRLSWPANVR